METAVLVMVLITAVAIPAAMFFFGAPWWACLIAGLVMVSPRL